MDGSDLVAHGVADELVGRVVHDEHLVDAELLGGGRRAHPLVVLAALEADGLAPAVAQRLDATLGQADRVVTPRGRGDHWRRGMEGREREGERGMEGRARGMEGEYWIGTTFERINFCEQFYIAKLDDCWRLFLNV